MFLLLLLLVPLFHNITFFFLYFLIFFPSFHFLALHVVFPDTLLLRHTGHTQKNGAVSKEFTLHTAPFFCVWPVLHQCSQNVTAYISNIRIVFPSAVVR
jgi:hypothetical protein